MTWNEVFCNTFKALSEELGLPPAGKSLVELCRADDADFCQEVVAKGWLSEAQMAHAAERYRLGKSKNGKPIFWMIDERGIALDGRIGDTWVSMIFKRRYPECGRSSGGVTAYPCLAHLGGSCDGRTEATEDRPRGLYNRILSVMCRQTRRITTEYRFKDR